ncbi:MAG: hypothetical protein Q9160_003571 [Pyrenula sp. 1 TL-2023]
MAWTEQPYALFCTVEVPVKTLSKWLEDNEECDPGTSDLLLVTSTNFDGAPRDAAGPGEGTKFPLSGEPAWPFKGSLVEECAKILKNAPKDACLDRHHFVVADAQSLKDSTVVVCRIGDKELKGEELDTFRSPAAGASGFLMGLEPGTWEEMQENRHREEVLGS